jgi:hypothetical protein
MAWLIYTLCAVTAAICAGALLGSFRRTRHRILLWSGLCFIALTINNALLIVDTVVLPENDLAMPRLWTAFAAVCLLLYGLLFEEA